MGLMLRQSAHQKSEKMVLVENNLCLIREKKMICNSPLDLQIWIVRGGRA